MTLEGVGAWVDNRLQVAEERIMLVPVAETFYVPTGGHQVTWEKLGIHGIIRDTMKMQIDNKKFKR